LHKKYTQSGDVAGFFFSEKAFDNWKQIATLNGSSLRQHFGSRFSSKLHDWHRLSQAEGVAVYHKANIYRCHGLNNHFKFGIKFDAVSQPNAQFSNQQHRKICFE